MSIVMGVLALRETETETATDHVKTAATIAAIIMKDGITVAAAIISNGSVHRGMTDTKRLTRPTDSPLSANEAVRGLFRLPAQAGSVIFFPGRRR